MNKPVGVLIAVFFCMNLCKDAKAQMSSLVDLDNLSFSRRISQHTLDFHNVRIKVVILNKFLFSRGKDEFIYVNSDGLHFSWLKVYIHALSGDVVVNRHLTARSLSVCFYNPDNEKERYCGGCDFGPWGQPPEKRILVVNPDDGFSENLWYPDDVPGEIMRGGKLHIRISGSIYGPEDTALVAHESPNVWELFATVPVEIVD